MLVKPVRSQFTSEWVIQGPDEEANTSWNCNGLPLPCMNGVYFEIQSLRREGEKVCSISDNIKLLQTKIRWWFMVYNERFGDLSWDISIHRRRGCITLFCICLFKVSAVNASGRIQSRWFIGEVVLTYGCQRKQCYAHAALPLCGNYFKECFPVINIFFVIVNVVIISIFSLQGNLINRRKMMIGKTCKSIHAFYHE